MWYVMALPGFQESGSAVTEASVGEGRAEDC